MLPPSLGRGAVADTMQTTKGRKLAKQIPTGSPSRAFQCGCVHGFFPGRGVARYLSEVRAGQSWRLESHEQVGAKELDARTSTPAMTNTGQNLLAASALCAARLHNRTSAHPSYLLLLLVPVPSSRPHLLLFPPGPGR
jgi:hypothetical protein